MAFNKVEYDNKYAKEKYDRIPIMVPKGDKDKIKAETTKRGYKSKNYTEKIRKMVKTGIPIEDWQITIYKGKKYYIEYIL